MCIIGVSVRRIFFALLTIGFFVIVSGIEVNAAVLSVPSEHKTIQDAINAASSGDTVQVSAGTYKEQIKLKEGVTLKGEGYEKTIIDGGKKDGNVVKGANDSVIEGFTIKNSGTIGMHGATMDASIRIESASMGIKNNRIVNNNVGILLFHSPASLISNNIIEMNRNDGISSFYSNPHIENNIIHKNGIYGIFCSGSKPTVVNNTIVENPTGIYTEVTSSVVKNNIFANSKTLGFQIVESPGDQKGVEPYLSYNLFWKNGYDLSNVKKKDGDVEKDPMFVDIAKGDFRLKQGSPAVNSGDPDSKYNDPDGSRADIGAFGGAYAVIAGGKGKNRDWASYKKSRESEIAAIEKNYTTARLGEKGSKQYSEENTRVNYLSYCTPCHGQEGKGDGPLAETLEEGVEPRDHTSAEYFSQKTDKDIFEVIKFGGANAGFSEAMPPFSTDLSDDNIMNLVKYIRALCKCQYKE